VGNAYKSPSDTVVYTAIAMIRLKISSNKTYILLRSIPAGYILLDPDTRKKYLYNPKTKTLEEYTYKLLDSTTLMMLTRKMIEELPARL